MKYKKATHFSIIFMKILVCIFKNDCMSSAKVEEYPNGLAFLSIQPMSN